MKFSAVTLGLMQENSITLFLKKNIGLIERKGTRKYTQFKKKEYYYFWEGPVYSFLDASDCDF